MNVAYDAHEHFFVIVVVPVVTEFFVSHFIIRLGMPLYVTFNSDDLFELIYLIKTDQYNAMCYWWLI